jgi:hypothetical protein
LHGPKPAEGVLADPEGVAALTLRIYEFHRARASTKPRTATASFRLDESALEALQEDAKKQNVSVNTLLNQLVLTYANYDRPMKRFQMVKLPASTFRYILQGAKDETIIEAGKSAGSDVPKTYIVAKWGELTVEKALEFLKSMSDHAKLFEYSEVVHDGRVGVTLSHNFGAKGSLFLQHYVQAMFAAMDKSPKFSPDENAVAFEIK